MPFFAKTPNVQTPAQPTAASYSGSMNAYGQPTMPAPTDSTIKTGGQGVPTPPTIAPKNLVGL